MQYLISWFFYLVAFLAGVLVAWMIVRSKYPTHRELRAAADKSIRKGASR